MSDKGVILGQSDIFKHLEKEDMDKIASLMDERRFQEGEELASSGGKAAFFFLLVSGTLMLSMAEGKALVMKTPGDFAGMALLSRQGVYISTVRALTDGTVFVLPRDRFLEIIKADTPAAKHIMKAWNSYLNRVAPFIRKQDFSSPAAGF